MLQAAGGACVELKMHRHTPCQAALVGNPPEQTSTSSTRDAVISLTIGQKRVASRNKKPLDVP
jgi:hypothetical protein